MQAWRRQDHSLCSDDEDRYYQKCHLKELLQTFSGKTPGFTIASLGPCQTHEMERLLVIGSSAIIFCHYRCIINAALKLLTS